MISFLRVISKSLIFLTLLLPGGEVGASEILSVVAHVHTTTSEGDYEPDGIAAMLAAEGIDAGIITDHDRLGIRWGLPFYRNFLGYTYRRRSIATDGARRYAARIREAASRHPGLILIPAVEANPYYRTGVDWTARRFRVTNLHEHILAIGLADSDLVNLPSIHNGFSPGSRWLRTEVLASLVIVLGVVAVLILRSRRRKSLRMLRARPRRSAVLLPLLAFVVGIAVVDAVVESGNLFDQYDADPGAAPYQVFIERVTKRGGTAFWAHPGVNETIRRGPFEVITRPYYDHLVETDGYTGFDAFDPRISDPGGLWDEILRSYCAGRRRNPPWALAQVDFRSGDSTRLRKSVNFVEVPERSERGIVDALREGRFYAARSLAARAWRLDRFEVSDGSGTARSGETLEASGRVLISARLTRISPSGGLRVDLIGRDGALSSRRLHDSGEITFEEAAPLPGDKTYYRLNAGNAARVELISNPVFVSGR